MSQTSINPGEMLLTEQQKATNLILQYISYLCQVDDKITAKQILRNDGIFTYLQIARVKINQE